MKSQIPFPKRRYKVIYADPPWSYNNGKTAKRTSKNFGNFFGRSDSYYDVMSLKDIMELPVSKIADKNCTLFMWCTLAKLDWGLEVMKAWGFKYRTCAFVWVKTQKDGRIRQNGMGWYTIQNAEVVLLGRKGKTLKRRRKDIKQIILAPNSRRHSEKPEEARKRIELLYGTVSRIELFARRKSRGWDCWGNEII